MLTVFRKLSSDHQAYGRPKLIVLAAILVAVLANQPISVVAAEDSDLIALLHRASNVAMKIEEPWKRSSALQAIATAQRNAGDIPGALQTALAIPEPGIRSNALVDVVGIQSIKGAISNALTTLKLIDETTARQNALAYVALGYAKTGNLEEALKVAAEIPTNYAAHQDALTSIAKVQAAAGDLRGALVTVADVMDGHPYATWGIFAPQLSKGDVDGALEVAEAIPDSYHRSYALWGIANQTGDLDRSVKIATNIPGGHARASAFHSIATSQLAHGDAAGALRSLHNALEAVPSIRNIWAKADIQWRIAASFAEAGDIQEARATALAIEQLGHRQFALRDIISVQARVGNYAGAVETAKLTGASDQALLTDFAFSAIAKAQAGSGDTDKARETVAKIRDFGSRVGALAVIATSQRDSQHLGIALQIAGDLREESEKGFHSLDSLEGSEKLRKADSEAVAVAIQATQARDVVFRIFRAIALGRVKANAIQEALGYAILESDKYHRSEILSDVAEEQAVTGDERGALLWAQALPTPTEQAFAFLGTANGLIRKSGEPDALYAALCAYCWQPPTSSSNR